MKQIQSDSSLRNLTPPVYPQWVQQQNIQTNQPNNEQCAIAIPLLTDELYTQLIDPLSKMDFERAIQIAGVRNLSELFQLADTYQRTLLMLAGMRGDVELIKIILSSTSNPDMFASMKDANNMSALMHAIKRRKPEPIKALLDNVKNPEQLIFMKNNENKAALMLAIEQSIIADLYGDYEIIIRHHPEMLEMENKYQAESIKVLLSYVSDKDALICKQDVDGRKMLSYALSMDNAELLKILLGSVDNPEELLTMKDSQGKNLLMDAASKAKVKSIVIILRSVKNPETFAMMKDSEGMTALMYAIMSGEPKAIKAILRNVNNPDQLAFMKNQKGYNALMLVAIYGDYYTTTTLLNHVKNSAELIYSSNSDGETALMVCSKNRFIDNTDSNSITAMLEKAKTIPYPYYKFSPTYSKGKNSHIPLNLDSLIFIKNTKWMNAFTIALKGNNVGAALTLLNSTTDILRLFTEENLEQCTAIDLFHKEYGVDMCDALIERVEQLQISNNSQDLDTVMWLLREREARYNQAN